MVTWTDEPGWSHPRRPPTEERRLRGSALAQLVVLEHPAADDHPLDVGGTLPDQQHRRLPVEPLDLVLLGEAVASMDPEGVLDDLRAVLAGEVLRHPGLEVVALAGVLDPRGPDHHLVGGLDLGRHLGQPEQHRLVLGDLLAEGLPLLGVGDAELEGPVGHPAARAATLTRPTSTPSIIW